jgi:hypothetical protein
MVVCSPAKLVGIVHIAIIVTLDIKGSQGVQLGVVVVWLAVAGLPLGHIFAGIFIGVIVLVVVSFFSCTC